MQITEASPAVRSSLRLLLNSFVALKKTVLCSNLDAQNLSVLGKDVPNFKGCEKKSVVLCSIVFVEKVALLIWLLVR